MARKVVDCRRMASETDCTLTLSGEEEEVLDEAVEHAVRVHKHELTPELREMLRGGLEDEEAFYLRIASSPERISEQVSY